MLFPSLALVASLVSVASAHFTLYEPYWRGSSFDGNASQWVWPCAGVSQSKSHNNRTEWPLTGGQLRAKFGHEWAITYINLGLGNEVTAFNISLVDGFNQTGSGEFCLPEAGHDVLAKLNIPEGTNASVQVIQVSHSGASLYNCADITFTKNASKFDSSKCKNSTGVGGVPLTSGPQANQTNGDRGGSAASVGIQSAFMIGAVAVAGAVLAL